MTRIPLTVKSQFCLLQTILSRLDWNFKCSQTFPSCIFKDNLWNFFLYMRTCIPRCGCFLVSSFMHSVIHPLLTYSDHRESMYTYSVSGADIITISNTGAVFPISASENETREVVPSSRGREDVPCCCWSTKHQCLWPCSLISTNEGQFYQLMTSLPSYFPAAVLTGLLPSTAWS